MHLEFVFPGHTSGPRPLLAQLRAAAWLVKSLIQLLVQYISLIREYFS